MKKQTGIWLDFKEAVIIEIGKEQMGVFRIASEIENYHPKGGARSKTPWGPMDKMSEGKYLERRKHQETAYFQNLIDHLSSTDELFIFGPAEAKDGLVKMMQKQTNSKIIIKGVEKTDSLSLNQKVAKVKAFFNAKKTA